MFNSNVLDVILGVLVTFLAISLITSAATEAISAVLALRQKTLRRGIQALLNDPNFTGLARDLYAHALFSPFDSGRATTPAMLRHPPAYVLPRQFALAFLDTLRNPQAAPPEPVAALIAKIDDQQLKRTVSALADRAGQEIGALETELAAWFDAGMDRVSGWYKRQAQWIGLAIAFLLAVALNADALHVTAELWDRPVMIDAKNLATGGDSLALLRQHELIGWQLMPSLHPLRDWIGRLIGWSLTAGATMFGAAFWFDLLQRVVQVRSTGTAPDEKEKLPFTPLALGQTADARPRPNGSA